MPGKPGMMQQQMPGKPGMVRQPHHARVLFIRVHRGDTLSRIASRYHMRVAQLKRLNHLRSDRILVGQRLRVR
jgi:hypothetical protein